MNKRDIDELVELLDSGIDEETLAEIIEQATIKN